MANPITERQLEVLKCIHVFSCEHGYPPTLHELSDAIGATSKGGAASAVKALCQKDLLSVTPRIARSMVLTEAGKDLVNES